LKASVATFPVDFAASEFVFQLLLRPCAYIGLIGSGSRSDCRCFWRYDRLPPTDSAILSWIRADDHSTLEAEEPGRADLLLEEGDIDGSGVWRRILAAIEELQRGREEGEAVN
jgi:hypothetical protein